MIDDDLNAVGLQKKVETIVDQYLSALSSEKGNFKRLAEQELSEEDQQNLRLIKEKIYAVFNGKTVPQSIYNKVNAMLSSKVLTLDMLGFKHGTDKAFMDITSGAPRLAHDYLRHYEALLGSYRFDKMILIEFGCFRGASLRMWEDWLPNAEILGVDIDENAKSHERGRVHVLIGDATRQETCDKIRALLGNQQPFVIVDDASHAWSDQRRSLEMFWSLLAPGGFYIVEDLECGSDGTCTPQNMPTVLDSQPFLDYVLELCSILRWAPDRRLVGNPSMGFHEITQEIRFSQLPQVVKDIALSLDSFHLMPGTLALKKKI